MRSRAKWWACALLTGQLYLADFLAGPVTPPGGAQRVWVEPGSSLTAVAAKLESQGVIHSPQLFAAYARLLRKEKKIRWGEYLFAGPIRPTEILSRISVSKHGSYKRLTVPEGVNLREIAALVEKSGLGDREEFLSAASDGEFLASLGIESANAEGYLLPNTYRIPQSFTERAIIAVMVHGLRKAVGPELKRNEKDLALTLHEILTLASMIEKETGRDEERAVVSSVFHNRLQLGMPLQSDPTAVYGRVGLSGVISKRDLLTPSDHNTYTIPGLPIGPIASPGLKSILAAIHPAMTDYLYFVSKNDGTHYFSRSLREHNRAVDRLQRLKVLQTTQDRDGEIGSESSS
jgi:UPF0755 protein